MQRRHFLKNISATAASIIVLGPGAVRAETECVPSQFGQLCSSYIPLDKLEKIYAYQRLPEWCWAASISMMFGFYNHQISQRRIVRDAYGVVENMPANYPAMLGSLDRQWKDNNGKEFTVSIDHLFAPELGIATLSIRDLITRLDSGEPVLYCTAQHAMILTETKYVATQIGPKVVEAWVMDPFPGIGLRQLSFQEIIPVQRGGQLRMAATVEVDDVDD